MPIPLYGAQAHGGKLISLDDPAVVKDLADADGTGGNDYEPYFVTGPIPVLPLGSFGRLREWVQSVPREGSAVLALTAWVDGMATGQTITRTLALGGAQFETARFAVGGTYFQMHVAHSDFTAPASVGASRVGIVRRRGSAA